jgi:murein L,D-transpeptidase YafK
MIRAAISLLVLLVVGGTAAMLLLRNRVKASDTDRVAVAREHCEAALRKLCADASLPNPPREIFLRVLKQDQRLEVWARETDPFALLKSYPFTAFCGELGPKRREGDRQIPEGLYVIDRFNPLSLFHLSLRVNYPNASDRVLSDPDRPGFDIYIHGSNQTVGCIPLGDEAIEELYVLALDTVTRGQKEIPIHIFPAAMESTAWEEYQAQHPEKVTSFGPFWENLAQAYRAFEETRLVPAFEVDSTGRYQMKREPIVAR